MYQKNYFEYLRNIVLLFYFILFNLDFSISSVWSGRIQAETQMVKWKLSVESNFTCWAFKVKIGWIKNENENISGPHKNFYSKIGMKTDCKNWTM